jgi:hypothetical protein
MQCDEDEVRWSLHFPWIKTKCDQPKSSSTSSSQVINTKQTNKDGFAENMFIVSIKILIDFSLSIYYTIVVFFHKSIEKVSILFSTILLVYYRSSISTTPPPSLLSLSENLALNISSSSLSSSSLSFP